MKQALNFK